MPQEELELIGSYAYEEDGHKIPLFDIEYIESKGLSPGFYVDYGEEIDGPFKLPSLALNAALAERGGINV